ncbi:hypothetical protein PHMEG_0001320 [Phytophthora megakarya]|uniref:Uncharacterized protein n=1 Tax=Phytophthora megakarya TaxID=4795 RepID=A0A225X209_9STRA|nr:hypothetical protein PHMEG_0001320 [Phytophthora megakarya]
MLSVHLPYSSTKDPLFLALLSSGALLGTLGSRCLPLLRTSSSIRQHREEAVESFLRLCALGLFQSRDGREHPVLLEAVLLDKEVQQFSLLWVTPLDLRLFGVDDLGFNEHIPSIFVDGVFSQPLVRNDDAFALVLLQRFNEVLNVLVLLNTRKRLLRSHSSNRVTIITATQDAQVHELLVRQVQFLQSAFKTDLQDRDLLRRRHPQALRTSARPYLPCQQQIRARPWRVPHTTLLPRTGL